MDNLAEFFTNFDFSKKIKLNNNYPLELHWSNDSVLTKKLRANLKDNSMKFHIEQLDSELEKLKNVPLWLKLDDSILKLSAFDIYHTLCMHFRGGDYEDQLFNSQEISFVSPAGPFKHLSIVDCVHSKTLEAFVYKNILQNNLAQRSFRLDTKGSALLSYGDFQENSLDISIEQITDNGILLSSDNYGLLEVIDDEQYFKLQMNTDSLKNYFDESSTFDGDDLFYSTNITDSFKVNSTKLIKSLKYDSADTGKFYLFCRYADMIESKQADELKNFISEFKTRVRAA